MATLPRYQKAGVQLQQMRELDQSGFREVAKMGQTITEVVDRMSDFAYKKQAAKAARRGEQAIMDQGAQPVLDRIAKRGGPTTIAEQAAYALGSRVASAEIATDAEIEISNILNQAQTAQAPLSAVRQQLADVADGYSAAMSNIDPGQAAVLRTNLMGSGDKAVQIYANWFSEKQAAAAKARMVQSRSVNKDAVFAGAVLPGKNYETIQADISQRANVMLETGDDPVAVQEWADATYSSALKENLTYQFVQGDLKTKRIIIERLDKGPLPGLDYTETQSFKKSLSAEMSAGISIAKGQASDVENLVGDQEKILTGGGMPDPEVIASLVTQIDNLGEFGTKAQGMIVSLADKMQLSDVYRRMTPSDLKNEVDALAFGIPGEGKAGQDTLVETERLAFATKMLDTMRTEIKKDPNGYAARSGMTYIDPADGKTKRVEVKPINFSDPSSWSDRVTVARVVASKYSQPPKYFSPEELTGLNTVLETGDRLAKQGILAAVVSSGGNVAPDLLREIAPNNPEFAQIGALSLSGSQSAADAALRGMEVLAAGNDLPGFTPTNTQLPFGEMMGQSMAFLPTSRGLIEKTARLIYADKVQKNGYTEFEENAWKMSIQEAAGSNGEFGGIQMVGAVATLIPTDITAEQFNEAMDDLDLLTIGIMTVTPKMTDGQLVSQEMIDAIKEDYEVYAVGDGQYRFIMGNPGVQGFKVAADEYGNEIRFNPSLLMGR
jgi:hypothetical protein